MALASRSAHGERAPLARLLTTLSGAGHLPLDPDQIVDGYRVLPHIRPDQVHVLRAWLGELERAGEPKPIDGADWRRFTDARLTIQRMVDEWPDIQPDMIGVADAEGR